MTMIDHALVASQLDAMRGRRVLVVGDLIADRYEFARPGRLSREAPVIIATHESEALIPGGGANALANLCALGVDAVPFGVVGDDEGGEALLSCLANDLGCAVDGVVRERGQTTIIKTRFLVGDADRTKQQVLRIDREPQHPPSSATRQEVGARLKRALEGADAVLFSDYGYGLIDPEFTAEVMRPAPECPWTIDSRYALRQHRGMTLATPNLGEVEATLGRSLETQAAVEAGGAELLNLLEARALLVTQGNQGMTLFAPHRAPDHVPVAGSLEVTDVSGAGDTVIATATAALAAGADEAIACRLANLAAGVTVMKVGAATCSPEELLAAVERQA